MSEEFAKHKVGAPARVDSCCPHGRVCSTWQHRAWPFTNLLLPVVAAADNMKGGGLAHRDVSMAAPLQHQKIGNKIVLSSVQAWPATSSPMHVYVKSQPSHVKPSENGFGHLCSCNTLQVCIEP